MIEITMNTSRLKLQIKGHATAEENADYSAICTAVSALAQGLVYCISKMDHAEGALRSLQYRDDPGDYYLLVIPEQWAEMMIKRRFRNYGDGLEMMAKAHPESVTMVWDAEKILPDKEDE
ncbi:MAG: ribosomal-processing cysteine protease Prp [Clostridiales bacterium]|nr:ribosomal-processing cysteine protease Prp [Clostridiales bacterium]